MNQRKLPIPDLALAAAGLLALATTFLPWWKLSESATIGSQSVSDAFTVNAWNAASHPGTLNMTITGPMAWIPMVLLLLLGALAVIRAYAAPQLLPGRLFYQIGAGVGALTALLVIIRWVTYFKAPNVNTGGVTATANSGASFGTFLGLLLGLAVGGAGIWALTLTPAGTGAGAAPEIYQQGQAGGYQQQYGQPQPMHPGPYAGQPLPDPQQTQRIARPQLQPPYGQPAQPYGQPPQPGYPQQQIPQAGQPQPPTWQ